MFKFLLRVVTRVRLFFMMGESLDDVASKIHGYDSVVTIDHFDSNRTEIIEPLLSKHQECFFCITNRNLHLQYVKSSMIKGNLIKNKEEDRLIVYGWYESRG